MYGFQGNAEKYPLDIKGYDRKIRLFAVTPNEAGSIRQWTTLQAQPGRFPAGHFGPEITFARKLFAAGYQPAIFKYSQPSTSLTNDWREPGAQGLYDRMLEELQHAVEQINRQGDTVEIRALVWIQGESDSETKAMSEAYGQRLQMLISHFRNTVARQANLPILIGLDEQHPAVKQNPEVIAQQKRIAAQDENVAFISMLGLEKADSTHLTPDGLQYHGNRLFDDFNKLVKNTKSE